MPGRTGWRANMFYSFLAGRVKLQVYERTNKFVLKINLAGKIDTSVCKITLFSTKINIKLKKLEGGKWESVGEEVAEE